MTDKNILHSRMPPGLKVITFTYEDEWNNSQYEDNYYCLSVFDDKELKEEILDIMEDIENTGIDTAYMIFEELKKKGLVKEVHLPKIGIGHIFIEIY